MSEWQPIETAPSGKSVLVHYKNIYGKSRIIKAKFISRFTEESYSGEADDGVEEYDEENDRFTYKEGWWEIIDNWGDYSFVVVNEGIPDYWMPLPEPPK